MTLMALMYDATTRLSAPSPLSQKMKSCPHGSSFVHFFVHFFLLTSPPLPPTLSTHLHMGWLPLLHPLFAIPSLNQHDASLIRLPRSSDIAEGWHHGFNSMLSCNHPTIWKFMEALKKEHNLIRMQLGRMRQLEEPERRAAKWIRYDDRIQELCDSFNTQKNVVNFLLN